MRFSNRSLEVIARKLKKTPAEHVVPHLKGQLRNIQYYSDQDIDTVRALLITFEAAHPEDASLQALIKGIRFALDSRERRLSEQRSQLSRRPKPWHSQGELLMD